MATPTLSRMIAALVCTLCITGSAHAMDPKDYPWIIDMANCPMPEYPKEAQRNEETGTTDLEMLVRTDGTVAASLVKKSSGHPLLDEAALATLSGCRYTLKGKAVPKEDIWQMVRYVWTLEDAATPDDRQLDSSCMRAPYPAGARDRTMTGAMTLSLLVRPDGTVRDTRIEGGSGHPALDSATRAALARCRFTQSASAGLPAADEWITMDYVWSEDDLPKKPAVQKKRK